MKILGINANTKFLQHDTSVCFVNDGKIIDMYEEERFDRKKHSDNFPKLSIERIFNKNNITINDIDIIAGNFDKNDIMTIFPNIKKIPQIIYFNHHMGHICDSFFQSGFKSAACLIIDGCGDCEESITLAHIKDNEIKILKQYPLTVSLGILYDSAIGYCNMGNFSEGKLMGLSSYGKPLNVNILKWNDETKEIDASYLKYSYEYIKNISIKYNNNLITLITGFMNQYFIKEIYPYSNDKTNDLIHYINFAATIQSNFNTIYLKLAEYLKELTGEDNLILSGGCIQNCVGNNIIIESEIYKNVFAGPAPHDAGTAAGYALYAAHIAGEKIINIRLRTSYRNDYYKSPLFGKKYNQNELANQLKNDKIILWYQGGSEIGPRALGHRSILANPSNRYLFNILNDKIKFRENYRPLAPIVPAELFDMIFDVKSYDLTEFMLRTIPIKEEWREKIPVVCHIDGTTRPQRLLKSDNPELYNLIMNFYEITGIPCLVNTSMNIKGQPIIETPSEAIKFYKSNKYIDTIVFNSEKYFSKG